MKLIARLCAYLFLLVLLVPVSSAFAKGPVDKITITGPGLTDPIEITDPEILSQFDPWRGAFVDGSRGPLAESPSVDQTYQIFFHLKDDDGQFQVIYTLQYYPDSSGNRGYIYLPGPGEEWYRVNIGTIIRSGSDGQWHYASEAWDMVMLRLLEERGVNPSAASEAAHISAGEEAPRSSFLAFASAVIQQNPWVIALTGSGIIGGVALWILLCLRRKPA